MLRIWTCEADYIVELTNVNSAEQFADKLSELLTEEEEDGIFSNWAEEGAIVEQDEDITGKRIEQQTIEQYCADLRSNYN